MRKRNLVMTMMILIVLGAAATIKALNSATTSAVALPTVMIPYHTSTVFAPTTTTTNIVPASVMERSTVFFQGTGDASAGSWVGP